MPEGYTQERTFEFENDGVMKVYQEISYHNGVVLNNCTLEAEGFREDSPVLNDGIKVMLSTVERVMPTEKGLQTASMQVRILDICIYFEKSHFLLEQLYKYIHRTM